jgi:ribosomal protein S18 acetylase RimI-like enzyme
MQPQASPTEPRESSAPQSSVPKKPSNLSVRAIEPQDSAPLRAMLRGIAQFKPEEIAVAEKLIVASVEGQGGYESLVAVQDDQPLGYMNFGRTPMTQATWDLYWIAVAPEAQSRGVGTQLLEALLATLRERGGRNVRIETSSQESYSKTSAFYARNGFRIEGRLRDFYSTGDDLLIYYRTLD